MKINDGILSIATKLIDIDKKNWISFYLWNNLDFINESKWLTSKIKDYTI